MFRWWSYITGDYKEYHMFACWRYFIFHCNTYSDYMFINCCAVKYMEHKMFWWGICYTSIWVSVWLCFFVFVLCLVFDVACVSGLSFLDCPFGFLQHLFNFCGIRNGWNCSRIQWLHWYISYHTDVKSEVRNNVSSLD
jgi:hypothetical protein